MEEQTTIEYTDKELMYDHMARLRARLRRKYRTLEHIWDAQEFNGIMKEIYPLILERKWLLGVMKRNGFMRYMR